MLGLNVLFDASSSSANECGRRRRPLDAGCRSRELGVSVFKAKIEDLRNEQIQSRVLQVFLVRVSMQNLGTNVQVTNRRLQTNYVSSDDKAS